MGLNESKGNMYEFVTHTWNTVKGACPHDCLYCYMKRWGQQNFVRFDKKEFKQFEMDMKKHSEPLFIFVGSSCDLFADSIPKDWIESTIWNCARFCENKYLFQSKNPAGFSFVNRINDECGGKLQATLCTTIETNRWYPEIMRKSPAPHSRARDMSFFAKFPKYVTIEPIIDFDMDTMVEMIKQCDPVQVNIGADSGNNGLPEPPIEKVLELVDELKAFTTVAKKRNLERLIKQGAK